MIDTPILIPTYSRPNDQHTLAKFPKYLRKRTWLVVRASEREKYSSVHNQIIVMDRHVKEVSSTRQWILEYAAYHDWQKIFVVDDDLDFYVRMRQRRKGIRLRECGPDDLIEMFDLLEGWLDKYLHVGVGTKWGNTLIKTPYTEVAKAICVFGMLPKTILDAGVSFTTHRRELQNLKSDIHFLMQMFLRGYPNRVTMEFAHEQSNSFQAEGGCSTYRTPETHMESSRAFARLYPDYVTLIEHEDHDVSKGKWPLRTRVAWKKAYRDGSRERNALI